MHQIIDDKDQIVRELGQEDLLDEGLFPLFLLNSLSISPYSTYLVSH